jgi:hypothetical protein
MKTIKVPGPSSELGVRLTREAAPGCTPEIIGLFLPDGDLNWTATTAEYFAYEDSGGEVSPFPDLPASFVPVRLIGSLCDREVTWKTAWQPNGTSEQDPIFFGAGPVGVVGWHVFWAGTGFGFFAPLGVLEISAEVDGKTYGPVTITFTGRFTGDI